MLNRLLQLAPEFHLFRCPFSAFRISAFQNFSISHVTVDRGLACFPTQDPRLRTQDFPPPFLLSASP